jgi:hypothetical protein
MCTNRLMFASPDFDAGRAPVSCVRTDSVESNAVQMQELGRTHFEFAVRMREIFDQLDDGIELS